MRVRTITYPPAVIVAIVVALGVAAAAGWHILRANEAVRFAMPGTSAASVPLTNGFDPRRIYAARVSSTVTIEATIAGAPSSGSGVVVDSSGIIVTASHVIHHYASGRSASSIYVSTVANDRVPATLLGIDRNNDLAVLQVNPADVRLEVAPIADSDRIGVGDPVVAIGAPLGQAFTPSSGTVSGIGREEDSGIVEGTRIADMLQFDAVIRKGNSGGPLFDAQGRLIGIVQQMLTPDGDAVSTGIPFAVSSNTMKRSVEQIRRTGAASRAWLGITAHTVSPQMARQFNLAKPFGALIERVAGPAASAGLTAGSRVALHMGEEMHVGDQVVSIAGRDVRQKEDILRIASRIDAGSRVEVEYYRDRELRTATLVTGSV